MKRGLSLAVTALLLLCACGRSDTSQQTAEVRFDDAQTAYMYTTEVADSIVSRARELYPDLTFDLNYQASRDDIWRECNADIPGNVEIPDWTYWRATRDISFEPAQIADEMVMPLLEEFIDDGWEVSREMINSSVYLKKDGYTLHVSGTNADSLAAGRTSRISISVGSHCLESPDDLASFDPEDPEAYFGPGSAPTVGPFTPPRTVQPGEL